MKKTNLKTVKKDESKSCYEGKSEFSQRMDHHITPGPEVLKTLPHRRDMFCRH